MTRRDRHVNASTISWQHRAIVKAARLARVSRPAGDKAAQIDPTRTPMPAHPNPPRLLVRGLRVEQATHVGWPVWTLRARTTGADRVVIGIHGGAYISDIMATQWHQYASVARRGNATVKVPLYPVAPWGTAEVVVPAMADLLAETVAAHGADAVGILADSAGGGLALAATQELVRRGLPTPGRMVLISPWLDVALSDPANRQIDDPLLSADQLVAAGRVWAGSLETTDPRVSPLFGSLDGLPRITVYAGSLDRLYPDALRLQQRALEEGADIAFVLRDGLVHDWAAAPFLPEAAAIKGDLLEQLLGTAGR